MPWTTLWPWPNGDLCIRLETTEDLKEEEKLIATAGLLVVFSKVATEDGKWPSIKEIRKVFDEEYPELSKKLITRRCYYKKNGTH